MTFSKESEPEIIWAKQKVGLRRAQVWDRNSVYSISRYVQTLLSIIWIEETERLEHCSVVWELFLTVPVSWPHLYACRREWAGRQNMCFILDALLMTGVSAVTGLEHCCFKRAWDKRNPHYLLEVYILDLWHHKHRRWGPAIVLTSPTGIAFLSFTFVSSQSGEPVSGNIICHECSEISRLPWPYGSWTLEM